MRRLVFLDWLRILAIVAVLTIHISSGYVLTNFYSSPSSWLAGNFYESLVRWCVPIFVMITGALLLNDPKEYSYKFFLIKRVGKVFTPLLGWSIIYYLYFVFKGEMDFSITEFIRKFSTNGISIHFWYIYMLLGLYLVTPLLKILLKRATKKDITYFLLLWLYASVISRLIKHIYGFSFEIELHFVTEYIGYYLLGYYLVKYHLPWIIRKIIYIFAFIGIIATFILTYYSTVKAEGILEEFWYDYHSPTVLLVSIGLFTFFKHKKFEIGYSLPFLPYVINKTNFGIYLVHLLVMHIFENELPMLWLNVHSSIAIPYRVALTMALSILIVTIIKKIPLLKKLV